MKNKNRNKNSNWFFILVLAVVGILFYNSLKDKNKKRLHLMILIIVVVAIILYEPLTSGRMHLWSEELEAPIQIALDGVTYTFSENLTVADFEKNGWTLDYVNDLEGEYVDLEAKLIPPGEKMKLFLIRHKIFILNRITIAIKNNSSNPMPYNQCECIYIFLNDKFGYEINVNLPKGITFEDSYGRIEEAYGKGKIGLIKLSDGQTINPLYYEKKLIYWFDSPYTRVRFTFFFGKLKMIDILKYSNREEYERSQKEYEPL